MNILLTGGAGFIGSHTAVVLVEAGYNVILYDNFCNSEKAVVTHIEKITGQQVPVVEGDVRDDSKLMQALREYSVSSVIHFSGLKAVGESVQRPIDYFDNNVGGTLSLLKAMQSTGINRLIFSSSATVYGVPRYLPIDENHPVGEVTNPYGRSKLHIEEILNDVVSSDGSPTTNGSACKGWNICNLRYFNPVGAHETGLIGDDPAGIPSNLMPYIAQVASGKLSSLDVFGDDYDTRDGTGVRDYIHVMDLAEGHVAALKYIEGKRKCSVMETFNLGTGTGYSVLEMVSAFEEVSGCSVPYKVVDRRAGDVAACYAKVDKAKTKLDWIASRDLVQMCKSTWEYQLSRKSG